MYVYVQINYKLTAVDKLNTNTETPSTQHTRERMCVRERERESRAFQLKCEDYNFVMFLGTEVPINRYLLTLAITT